MKSINVYIAEKFQVGKDNIKQYVYVYYPKDKDELIKCIKDKIKKEGLGTKDKPLDLNDIDTSQITDMGNLFDAKDGYLIELSKNGQFDISNWNVSNVKNMSGMFIFSTFNGDISDWDVSKVTNMHDMFYGSSFDGDISCWDVRNVENLGWMFYDSEFTGKNGNLDNWNIKSLKYKHDIFTKCPLEKNTPKWYHA